MEEILKLLSGYSLTSVLSLLFLLGSAGVGLYNIGKKVLAVFEAYRLKRNAVENKDTDIHNKLDDLYNKINEDREKIAELTEEINNLEVELTAVKSDINKVNKATSRNAVYKLANELIAKQWMSQSESESLQELCDIYMKSGDTRYVIPNIIQRAISLPVLTEEEIEAKMNNKKSN